MHDLVLTGITKSFGAARVLRDVDLSIDAGEFVALMGPNGAGKSTLVKILAGVHPPTGGEIRFGGRVVSDLSADPRVGFLHQDLGLIPALNVMENLRLGEPPLRRAGLLDRRRETAAARAALTQVRLDRPVDTLVADLSPGEQALVAVARLLARGARLLVVDEATSSLTQRDAERLVQALRAAQAEGATVIMVSHRLAEILDGAGRVIVLQDGRVAGDRPTAGLTRNALVALLGAPAVGAGAATRAPAGAEVLRMEAVRAGRAGPLDLAVRAGEVVGLTGLSGSGLHDVAFAAHGSLAPQAGTIHRADGVTVAIVPPHREREGGFAELSLTANLTISSLSRWRGRGLLRGRAERAWAGETLRRLSVVPASPDAIFGTLSGGNKQKVIFGRALARRPQLCVLCEPTRGVDVATRHEIYRLIEGLRADGAAVLVTSSDAEDLVAVCDRAAVIADGALGEMVAADDPRFSELEGML